MKKKLIIIGIIITLLVIIGIITGIEDKSRIEKMEEPKYTIKLVNSESGKITYCGLGYIIVRDTAVSPYESFASSLRVKFRGWFMGYDFFRNNENPKDESEYADSIKSMFPKDIANEMINYGVSNDILKNEVQEYYSGVDIERNINNTPNIDETATKPINNNTVVESNLTQTESSENEAKPTGDFKIVFKNKQLADSYNNVYAILDKSETNKYDYSIYAYMGSVNIIIDGIEYSLKDALKSNKITMEKIIEKAKKDIPDAIVYRDGGSTVYHYENYTIIKVNKVNGNRDVYIGPKDMTLNDVL